MFFAKEFDHFHICVNSHHHKNEGRKSTTNGRDC